MQRINISVDVNDNEILSREIEKAIEGAVKAKARSFFHEKIESEIKRVSVAEFERLNKRGGYYRSDSVVEKKVKELLDAKLTEAIGEITVSREDVQNRIEEKLKDIASSIDYAVGLRVEKLSIKDYVKGEVVSAVRRLYPQEILRLAEQKEIEELRKRVKDLETENEALKAGKR